MNDNKPLESKQKETIPVLRKEVNRGTKASQTLRNIGLLAGAMLASFSVTAFVIGSIWGHGFRHSTYVEPLETTDKHEAQPKIQIAVALDSSSSMDGLLDQTRVAIWDIVNTFSETKIDGKPATLELALIEYGNDSISKSDNYVRVLSDFGDSLDDFSAKLFEVETDGGDEYPGAVIIRALNDLKWSENKRGYKAIVVAGNEDFYQGPVDPIQAIKLAKKKGVKVNTVFCGAEVFGKSYGWTETAALGAGTYLAINQANRRRYVKTKYDNELLHLGKKLNTTYMGYGKRAAKGKSMQRAQDEAVAKLGSGSVVDRMVSKTKSAYNNSSWDLVDATHGGVDVGDIPEDALPAPLKNLSKSDRKQAIKKKYKERANLVKEIESLEKKRRKALRGKSSNEGATSFDSALQKSVASQLKSQGFETNE